MNSNIGYWTFGFVIIAVILAGGCAQKSLQEKTKTVASHEGTGETINTKFSCENDNSVQTRAYVLLMGFADHHKEGWVVEKYLMEKDPKAKFVMIYDQDENSHIEDIGNKFLADMDEILKKRDVDELVIFGSSAGGVTASYAIGKLNFSGPVALHTLASPLNGYDLTGFRSLFIGNRTGFLRDIAIGFKPFTPPGKNVKVYHHKTVTDSVIKAYCGDQAAFCDPVEIQNNNLRGSKEFFYPQYDHNSIMRAVIKDVLACYNTNLSESDIGDGSESPGTQTRGLSDLCSSESECNIFCKDNFGRCKEYCQRNPENPLCQKQFLFELPAK